MTARSDVSRQGGDDSVADPGKRRCRNGSERGFANVRQGVWGENAATDFLRSLGWRVIGRNIRPCPRDRRCEIDIIAQPCDSCKVVFVEVKTHARKSEAANRLCGVDARKRRNLLRACANWIMRNHWHGDFRLDVVEVYGDVGSLPAIDHIENVPLFPPKWRFW